MAYVFTSASAAPVIKGYSPELMVLPDLPEQPTLPMLGNLTAAVLGPTGQPTEQELQVCVGGDVGCEMTRSSICPVAADPA